MKSFRHSYYSLCSRSLIQREIVGFVFQIYWISAEQTSHCYHRQTTRKLMFFFCRHKKRTVWIEFWKNCSCATNRIWNSWRHHNLSLFWNLYTDILVHWSLGWKCMTTDGASGQDSFNDRCNFQLNVLIFMSVCLFAVTLNIRLERLKSKACHVCWAELLLSLNDFLLYFCVTWLNNARYLETLQNENIGKIMQKKVAEKRTVLPWGARLGDWPRTGHGSNITDESNFKNFDSNCNVIATRISTNVFSRQSVVVSSERTVKLATNRFDEVFHCCFLLV